MTRSTTSKKRKNVSYNSNNDAHITQSITNVLDKSTATIETVITKKAPDPTPELNKMSSNATTLTEDITFNPLAIEASTGPPIISTPPSRL
jgi:glycine cleavage system regulatory protein